MYDRIQDTPLKTKVLYTKTATTITGIVGTQKHMLLKIRNYTGMPASYLLQ